MIKESYNDFPSERLFIIASVTPPGVETSFTNSSLFDLGTNFSAFEEISIKSENSSAIFPIASLFSYPYALVSIKVGRVYHNPL